MIGKKLTYKDRITLASASIAKRLLTIMDEKKTNLAISADVTSAKELLFIADQLGPHICILKTHIDIIDDFNPELILHLKKLAHEHQFLLFEDRKFADIGSTVAKQYAGGIYRIADWADIINAHTLPGMSILQGLHSVCNQKSNGLLLIAEMSSENHLMSSEYTKKTLHMAEEFPDFVVGFITQHALTKSPEWINLTPGIKFEEGDDSLGQRYLSPYQAIFHNHADVMIVGRGILNANDILAKAQEYRYAGWDSYLKRIAS